jgi:hypothetical protein
MFIQTGIVCCTKVNTVQCTCSNFVYITQSPESQKTFNIMANQIAKL